MATNDAETEERLKSALWYTIGQLVDEENLKTNCNATPQYIGALTELVWAQIENASKDLEAFAKHANRTQISSDDVMLLSRRNEGLEAVLRSYLDKVRRDKMLSAATAATGGAGAGGAVGSRRGR